MNWGNLFSNAKKGIDVIQLDFFCFKIQNLHYFSMFHFTFRQGKAVYDKIQEDRRNIENERKLEEELNEFHNEMVNRTSVH